MDWDLDGRQIWWTGTLDWDDAWAILCVFGSGSQVEVDRFAWALSFFDTFGILVNLVFQDTLVYGFSPTIPTRNFTGQTWSLKPFSIKEFERTDLVDGEDSTSRGGQIFSAFLHI